MLSLKIFLLFADTGRETGIPAILWMGADAPNPYNDEFRQTPGGTDPVEDQGMQRERNLSGIVSTRKSEGLIFLIPWTGIFF
jgi:hypothetical protein